MLIALAVLCGIILLGYWLWSGRDKKVAAARAEAKEATADTNATADALATVNKQIAANNAKSAAVTALMLAQAGDEAARQRVIAQESQGAVDAELSRRGLTRDPK